MKKLGCETQRRTGLPRFTPTIFAVACTALTAASARAQQASPEPAAPAPAQAASAPVAPVQVTPAPQASSKPSGAAELQEIVVTAQRRSSTVLKTPLAITAVSGDSLVQSGTTNAWSLGNLVPNLQVERSVGTQVSIRGISSENSLESGDPSVAFNVDGVYIGRQQSQSGSFLDLERIEVLRGPQGTLYGRNATGGAINLIPNKPSNLLEGSFSVDFGNYNAFRSSAMLNVPVTSAFAIRAAVSTNRRDSILQKGPNSSSGAKSDLGSNQDDVNYRLQGMYRFSPTTSLRLSLDGSENRALPPMQVPLANFYRNTGGGNVIFAGGEWYGASSSERRTVDWNPAFNGQNKEHDRGATLEYNQDVGIGTLTYLGAKRSHGYYKREPVYFLSLGQANRGQPFDNTTTSHELRIASKDTGALTWVAGLYRFDEDTKITTQFLSPLPGPLQGTVNGVAVNYRYFDNHAKADSTAGFAQATYAVLPELRLTAGIRATKDNKDRTGTNTQQVGATFDPNTDLALLNDAEVSYRRTNGKLGVEYDLTPTTLIYGSVSTGYKAGGYNDGCLATTPGCNNVVAPGALFYKPESLKAYEVGVKGRFLERKMQLSVAAFRYDYTDMQLQGISASTGLVTTTNAAKSTITGLEAEATYRLSPEHAFNATLALLRAKYDEYQINATTNWGGLDLDRSPKHSVTLGYQNTYSFESGATVVSTINLRAAGSSVFSNFSSGLRYTVPSYTKTDLTVTYNDAKGVWYAQGYANNLEDKVRPQGAVLGGTFVTDPRTFGVRLGARF